MYTYSLASGSQKALLCVSPATVIFVSISLVQRMPLGENATYKRLPGAVLVQIILYRRSGSGSRGSLNTPVP